MTRLAVLGAGSWGTALGITLASRFTTVALWARTAERAAELCARRENMRYLPGFRLPPNLMVSCDMAGAISEADMVLSVVPSAQVRRVWELARGFVSPQTLVVSATKGIEEGTLCRMSEVIGITLRPLFEASVAVLSGPTFAQEIAAGEPAAVVVAAQSIELAEKIQHAFATTTLRLYASADVTGVEIGAAMKNVIAIGAGVCRGLGLGSNSVAALITRGLAETTRLALKMGGHPRTLSGLAGLGDLVLTATGDLSRNRTVGVELGRGRALPEILKEMSSVAEGVSTCRAAYQLGQEQGVDLPIVNKMYELLYEDKEPLLAIRELMERPLTSE